MQKLISVGGKRNIFKNTKSPFTHLLKNLTVEVIFLFFFELSVSSDFTDIVNYLKTKVATN